MSPRRVRALYFQPAASFGGAERQAAQNIRLLPRFDVDVLPVVGPGRQIGEFLEDAGVAQYVFRGDLPDDPKKPRGSLERAGLLYRWVASFFHHVEAIEREAQRFGADVLFASRPYAWSVAGMAAARLGLPAVWRAGTQFEHWVQPSILACYGRARPPRAVVYTSVAIRDAIEWALPRSASMVVHNGVDTERFHPGRRPPSLRAERGLSASAPVIGFVGRISPEKGTRLLVDMCRTLARAEPRVQLLVAGDSGWRGRLEAALSQSGLSARVHLLGFVRAVERVYAASDVVVSTSEAEGCPNALLEAMAMGRAVVATDVGGTGEIIRDGIDGVLVRPGDAAAFALAVASLLASPARREALGEAAAASVSARFSQGTQVARLAEVIHWAAGRTVDVDRFAQGLEHRAGEPATDGSVPARVASAMGGERRGEAP